ncbi:chitinase [Chytriomyces confervae]|uniref:Chitinase n=1 Tax=Chytriomyces confervae TaxID=246404 RepID=A0A507DTN6_9FUNG|nr:chitinase [Chytriomyces confervae]
MAAALITSLGSACNSIYGPDTRLGRHLAGLGISFNSPSPAELQSKAEGLARAIELFPGTLQTQSEVVAFVANIVFESICLTAKEEIQCLRDPARCVALYGEQFWGRGYVQLTGRANYEAFAVAINRPDVVTNPSLVATDETLAWSSAVWFWSNSCRSSRTVGSALMCINSPECGSATSTVYYQYAPWYRLAIAQQLASSVGVDASTQESIAACPQMGVDLNVGWSQFCQYHGNGASVTCREVNSGGAPSLVRASSVGVDTGVSTSAASSASVSSISVVSANSTATAVSVSNSSATISSATATSPVTLTNTSGALAKSTNQSQTSSSNSSPGLGNAGNANSAAYSANPESNGLSGGAIAGISVGCVAVAAAAVVGGVLYKQRYTAVSKQDSQLPGSSQFLQG